MRPEDMAEELGYSGKTIRQWLREKFPRAKGDVHQPWHLTAAQVRAVRAKFESRRMRAASREKMVVTTVALPESMHRRLVRAAERANTVMTELARQAISDWLDRHATGSKATEGPR